jgi:hypothetical protein
VLGIINSFLSRARVSGAARRDRTKENNHLAIIALATQRGTAIAKEKQEIRKEGKKERRKEGKKERKKEGKKER